MGLTLSNALRLQAAAIGDSAASLPSIALAGAGGKTTAAFVLARESPVPVAVSSTTHFGAWQIGLADQHVVATQESDLPGSLSTHITLFTGAVQPDGRTQALAPGLLEMLRQQCADRHWLLLIEADGSRERPLKAPAEHEPAIPLWADLAVVVAGLSGLGKPLSADYVHRPEIFADIAQIQLGDKITPGALARVLADNRGGLRHMPPNCRRVLVLNQADTLDLQSQAQGLAHTLLGAYDAVIAASLRDSAICAVHEPCAGIILAAGESARYGRAKQLLDWHGRPFISAVAGAAREANLSPIIVVTGAHAEDVEAALSGVPVHVTRNERWQAGQAASIAAGLAAAPAKIGSAVFLLADQPQVTPAVIRALVEAHAGNLAPIVAPMINEERRGNPVLFDRTTFADLSQLRGDIGGRAIFSKHKVHYLPWYDGRLLLDIDSREDYERLLELDSP
jgi:molybdenum cofactor cytidylyltransferase